MAIFKNEILDVDLNKSNTIQEFAKIEIGEGDIKSNRFGARIFIGENPADLAGVTCIAYFVRQDGITLVIEGTISGNEASVILPQAAFSVEGNFSLAIKLSGSGFIDTVRIIHGTVVNTTTGTVTDPSGVVPSLEDLEEIIGEAEAAAEEIDKWSIGPTQITGTRYKIVVTKET